MWLWLLPALGAMVCLGLMGITTKLALRTIEWQQIVFWVPICYAVFAVLFAVFNNAKFPLGRGGFWAAMTGICASAGLVLVMLALSHASASTVIPVTAVYPALTVVVAAIFLSESFTVPKVIGTLLVVAGAVIIGRWSG